MSIKAKQCFVVFLTLFLFVLGILSVHAEENQTGNTTQQSPTINVQPMKTDDAISGLKRAQQDMSKVGQGAAPLLATYGVVIGVVMILIGTIFSKKVLKAGVATLGLSIMALIVLGDMNQTIEVLGKFAEKIRSYF